MLDVDFSHKFVPGDYPSVAAREAVLGSIFGQDIPRDPQDGAPIVLRQVEQLVSLWRARVAALHDAHWDVTADPKTTNARIQYLRNCNPFFVRSLPITRLCRQRMLCPFCYGRWTASLCGVIDGAFPHDYVVQGVAASESKASQGIRGRGILFNGARGADSAGYSRVVDRIYKSHLVISSRCRSHSWDDLHAAVADSFSNRGDAVRSLGAQGAFVVSAVVPETATAWQIQHRLLLMVRADHKVPDEFVDSCATYERIEQPTHSAISRAVALVAKYPVQLLTEDAAHVVRALHILRPYRQRLFYGKFRQSHLGD